MNSIVDFIAGLGLGPVFFYPLVVTLIVVMAWYSWDEAGNSPDLSIARDEK